MNDWQLHGELRDLERELAALPQPGPPKRLQKTVLRDVRAELRGKRHRQWYAYAACAAVAAAVCANLSLSSARERHPFDVVPVSGRVTYEDGTPISGTPVLLAFSSKVEPIGNMFPRDGIVDVETADGTFSQVTTDPGEPGDGLIVGKHTVSAVLADPHGKQIELTIVKPEITITDGDNQLVIMAKKPDEVFP